MTLLSDSNPTQATVDQVKMLFMKRFPDLMMEEAWMPEVKDNDTSSPCLDPAVLVLVQDSPTNKALDQAQLDQDQVSTLVLQSLPQALLPISTEHLEQDIESKAKPPFQLLLQPSCQSLPPISAEHLGREDVESEAKPSLQSLLQTLTDYFKKKNTESKNKSMNYISLLKKMLTRRMNKNIEIENRTILVKQV